MIPLTVCQRHPQEIQVMQKHGMICKNPNGHLQLSSLATVSVTVISKPQKVKGRIDSSSATAYEGRQRLQDKGWTVTEYGLNCSVQHLRMMKYQCKEYYSLLLCHQEHLLVLTDANCFSHVQKHGYYKVIGILCCANPFDAYLCIGQHICFDLLLAFVLPEFQHLVLISSFFLSGGCFCASQPASRVL